MTDHKKLYIDGLTFECWKWDHQPEPDVDITYTEHSPDHWYSDHETTVGITRDEAIDIINFLLQAFELGEEI